VVIEQVLVCQNTSCHRLGSQKVLATFQRQFLNDDHSDITILGSGCLGECGNGPMVLVLPEEVWYCRVHPDEVNGLINKHLQGGQPIQQMLYRKFHPKD
jgi:(2Fe-2S) ferredoxin